MVSSLRKAVQTAIVDFTAKSGPLSLRANFSWTFIGSTIYRGSQWAILVILAKLTSPEAVGQFALGLAITAPIIMGTGAQLRQVQATDARREYVFGDYLTLRLGMTGLALLIIFLISVISKYPWETTLVILLVGLSKAVEAISDVYYGLYQQRERMDRIAISMIIKALLSLAAFGGAVYFTRDIGWGAAGLVLAWLVLLFIYDIPTGHYILHNFKTEQENTSQTTEKLRLTWHLPTLKKLFLLTAPLGVGTMLISLNTSIPRYATEHFLGARELGIFAAMAYLVEVGRMITMALGSAATPRLAQYYADKRSGAFQKLLLRLVAIGAFLGLLGVVVALIGGKPLLTLIYKPEYAEHISAFILVMIAGGIRYVSLLLANGMMAARYFNVQVPLYGMVTVATVAACLLLIPPYGLNGAAMAMVVSASAQLIGTFSVNFYALRKLRLQENPIG